jgi:hypothetical protein
MRPRRNLYSEPCGFSLQVFPDAHSGQDVLCFLPFYFGAVTNSRRARMAVKVTIAGPPITDEMIKQVLTRAGLDGAEVTCTRGDGDFGGEVRWHVTLVTGGRVLAGGILADGPPADRLCACLQDLLRADHQGAR